MAETSITVRLIDETRAGFADINRNLGGLDSKASALGKTMDGLRDAAIGFASALASRQILNFVDSIQNLDNRLRLVTNSQEELNSSYTKLFKVAQDTRAPIDETANLYVKLSQSQKMTKTATEDLIPLTKAFAQTLAISGTSGETAAGVIRQFSEAMASGRLQGDELNRMLENNPKFMNILSEQTGIGRDQLKSFAEKGVISAEVAMLALKQAMPELAEEFGKTSTTVSQAITTMGNEFKRLSRDFLDSSGVSEMFVNAINHITNNMENLIPIIKIVGVLLLGLAVYFAPVTATVIAVTAAVVMFADVLGPLLKPVVDAAEAAISGLIKTVVGFVAAIKAAVKLENPFEAFSKASSEYEVNSKKATKATTDFSTKTTTATGVTTAMATALKNSGAATLMAKTAYGDFQDELENAVEIAKLDSKQREIQIQVNKAYEAKAKDLKKSVSDLSAEEKTAVEEYVKGKITEKQSNEAATASRKKLLDDSVKFLQDYADEYTKRNATQLTAQQRFDEDSKKLNIAFAQYLLDQDKFTRDERLKIDENFTNAKKNIQTRALDDLTKEYSKYYEKSKTEDQKVKDDLQALETAYQLARKDITIFTNDELLKLDQDYANNKLAIQSRSLNKLYEEYSKYNGNALSDTDKFVKAKNDIEEAYRVAMMSSENLTAEQRIELEKKKNASLLGAQSKFNQEFQKAADDQRKYEMTATEAYIDAITKLDEANKAGLITSQEQFDLVRRKIERDYRDNTAREYSALYSELTDQIQKFTGLNTKEFNTLKDVVKLVFGVDIDTIIKQAFAEFIKYVIGFRSSTQSEMSLVPNILKGAFSDTSPVSNWVSSALGIFKSFSSSVGDIFSGIGSFISKLFSSSGSGNIISTITSGLSTAVSAVSSTVGSVVSSVGSVASSVVSTVGSVVSTIGEATGISSAISSVFGGSTAAAAGSTAAAAGSTAAVSSAASTGIMSTISSVVGGALPILALVGIFKSLGSDERNRKKKIAEQDKNAEQVKQAVTALRKQGINYGYFYGSKIGEKSYYSLVDKAGNESRPKRYIDTSALKTKYTDLLGPLNRERVSIDDAVLYYMASGDTQFGAKGLAYRNGMLDRATVFGTKTGMAVGGEMGTEAIMPLSRDSRGRLGVTAAGGSGVNVNFTINAVDAKGIDQLLIDKKSLITNIVRTAVADRGGRF